MVWDLFDGFYTSWSAGMKPDMDFYKLVLNETKADPLRTVFVDDNLENVLVARSLGITSVFENTESCARVLPCSPDSTGDYAIVSGWEAMVERPRAPIPLRLLELVQKAEDANRDEEALY